MANKISRREILGLGAATIAGVGVLGKAGHASNHGGGSTQYQPAAGQQKSQGGRPYWEKSYSGGPIDVKPLATGLTRQRLQAGRDPKRRRAIV